MFRLSIKTKLSAVISTLVLSFIAFNLLYFPRWVEQQIRTQAELSARQVAESASYALSPAVSTGSNRDIAKQFSLSEETVKRHLSNIFDKTGVSTRLELALFAIAHHLVEPQ